MGSVTPIPEEKPSHGIGGDLDPSSIFSISDWGFDTVAMSFRPKSSAALCAIRTPIPGGELLNDPERGMCVSDLNGYPAHVSVSASGNWSMKLDFAWIQGFPDSGILRVEGRAAALIARDARAVGLVRPEHLSKVEGSVLRLGWSVLGSEVFDVSRFEFRRWDLAVDLTNAAEPVLGSRTMEALAAVRLPYWGRAGVHHDRGRSDIVTGAAWPATGRRQFRVYDKGVELKHPRHRQLGADGKRHENPRACLPGSWLRMERQIRPTNPDHFLRRSEMESADLRSAFLGRWASLLDWPSIMVGSPEASRLRVSDLFADGVLGPQAAKRLLGETAAAGEHLDGRLYDSHQALAAKLGDVGIVLAANLPASESVELSGLLRAAADCWPCGSC